MLGEGVAFDVVGKQEVEDFEEDEEEEEEEEEEEDREVDCLLKSSTMVSGREEPSERNKRFCQTFFLGAFLPAEH